MPLRAALLALAVVVLPAGSATAATVPTALVVFVPSASPPTGAGFSAALMSGTQGSCPPAQLALDAGAGSRVGCDEYDTPLPAMSVVAAGGPSHVTGWSAAAARARAAPQLLIPGLLAQLAGGAAYAGPRYGPHLGALLAADRRGRIAAVSLVATGRVVAAARALLDSHRLVVADLPGGPAGHAQLAALAAMRRSSELLVAIQRPANGEGTALLFAAIAGLPGGGGHELTSATTSQRGMVAATDLAPTILAHLGLPVPAAMLGRPIAADGALSVSSLEALESRLRAIPGRRPAALAVLLGACALMLALAGLAAGTRGRAWALRVAALALLWLPVSSLVPAALELAAESEYAMLATLSIALAVVSDRLIPWPRAPVAPAVVTVVALAIDALAGTELLLRALPGPDPLGGVRFHGIGNELKSVLAVMVLVAVAAAVYPSRTGRRPAAVMAGAGVVLAAVEGSAKVGAGVGGTVLVAFGFAVATAVLLGGAPTRRRLAAALLAPAVALAALAGLDLLTAGGTGHLTGSVLHARSTTDLWHVLVRRYTGAWRELADGPMVIATAVALLGCLLAVARPARVLGSLASDPAWTAALFGGVAAGVCGSLVEDSGPLLLLVAVFTLACVGVYARGRPSSEQLALADLRHVEAERRVALEHLEDPVAVTQLALVLNAHQDAPLAP